MMKFMSKKLNKKGFTILELLVVVAIIAILAVIAVPQFLGAIDKSRVSAQVADLNSINKAVVMYNFDTSAFPSAEGALTTDLDTAAGWNGPYINAFPANDKWGKAIHVSKAIDCAAAGVTSGMSVISLDLSTAPASCTVALLNDVNGTSVTTAADTATGTLRYDATNMVAYYVVK